MNEALQQIPIRIKELREILEISPEKAAEHLKISVGEYQGLEEGKQDIPISILYEISILLGVDMTVLLTGDSPRMNTHTLVRQNEGMNVERFSGYSYSALAYNFINRIMEPLLVKLSPSDAEPELVTHLGQEFNYVVSGTMKIHLGKHDYILKQGDSIYFDPRLPHSQKAVDNAAVFLTVICEPKDNTTM
ncbi:MAG: XRE family transcriptional regulator [Lachnoclostridium sp.]|jgi:mannose-6-phosphate isomerase-like protein (cupin superfamily)|nr:XRE family transcriptional regulator [Lachnoclostridium sp.]